jgi:hypothetical protein
MVSSLQVSSAYLLFSAEKKKQPAHFLLTPLNLYVYYPDVKRQFSLMKG